MAKKVAITKAVVDDRDSHGTNFDVGGGGGVSGMGMDLIGKGF